MEAENGTKTIGRFTDASFSPMDDGIRKFPWNVLLRQAELRGLQI